MDILRSRVQHKNFQELSESLYERMFNLRFEAVRWFVQENLSFREMLQLLENKINDQTRKPKLHKLGAAVQLVLQQYKRIVAQYLENVDFQNLRKLTDAISEEKPDYDFFRLLELHPDNRVKFIKKWLDQSLSLETGLVIAELYILGEIEMPARKIDEELIPFLQQTLTRFGAYSMFTGFWTPENPNEDQQTTNMKIFASTLELDFGNKNKQVQAESFYQLLQN